VKLIREPAELQNASRKVCLAIGMFDGVHLGHQQVIRQTVLDARRHNAVSVVVTFDRHPNSVVAPDKTPRLIYTLSQKLRWVEEMGVDATLLLEFNRDFSKQTGEEFINYLAKGFGHLHSVCVGSTFTFGHKRSGNVELLKKFGADLHFQVHGLAAVALAGRVVSSTRIRELISAGLLDEAGQCLGRSYCLAGMVEKGNQLGRQLGFPTANINVTGLVTPPHGVYAACARVGEREFPAATNIGMRPTISGTQPELRVEAHLLDFNEDIYGEELELCFVEKIRDEQKFSSLEELKKQIGRDVERARKLLS
jgi:riboflavin kinase / FMN adenylyltransferase